MTDAPSPQCSSGSKPVVTDEMLTAAMRAFERMSSVLRYREKDKWHTCDVMGMRDALKAALRTSPTPQAGVIEQCARIAEPWAGFWPQDNATEADKAVIAVRTEIAAKIRSLSPQAQAGERSQFTIEKILNDHFCTGEPGEREAIKAAAEVLRSFLPAQGQSDRGALIRVAQMAKAAAEMELGFAASPDFSPREMLDTANEALAASPPAVLPAGAKWRHLKRGSIVTEIARGFAQVAHHPIEEMTCVVIYRHDEDGRYWVRNAVEFDDGRFEAYPVSSTEGK